MLELLSDSRSRPELDRWQHLDADRRPHSNNSRERRGAEAALPLPLLDYPELEREMEIVRCTLPICRRRSPSPGRGGADGRALDLRSRPRSPRRSTGANAAVMGAEDIDRKTFEQSMRSLSSTAPISTWSPSGWD